MRDSERLEVCASLQSLRESLELTASDGVAQPLRENGYSQVF